MDYISFFSELKRLTREEIIGKEYCQKYGKELNLGQFLYILKGSGEVCTISDLETPEAIQEQRALVKQYERVKAGGNVSAQLNMTPDRDIEIEQMKRYIHFNAHAHDFFELVCVLSGECAHIMDGQRFVHPAGDLAIVPPDVRHEHFASEDCVCLTSKIRATTLLSVFHSLISNNSILSAYFTQIMTMPAHRRAVMLRGGDDPFIKETQLMIYAQQINDKRYSGDMIAKLWELLLIYYMQNYEDTITFLEPDTFRNLKTSEILNYIFMNYQTITLEETAKHFHYNSSYLSTKIRQMTGKTFSRLLHEYRLHMGAELIDNTEMKLFEICNEIGMTDPSQFARAFKEFYGVSPKEYRKRRKGA